CQHGYGLPFTF
nr:immunoglobulin light chain junction region [Macaca mulatta]